MKFKDCSLTGLRWHPLSLVAGDYSSACRWLITDSSQGLKSSLFCRQKWCPRREPSGSASQQLAGAFPLPSLGLGRKSSLYHLRAALGLSQPPLHAHDLIWIRVILENKMLKFSFRPEQCHIRQLKKTCSQHQIVYTTHWGPFIMFHLVLLFKGWWELSVYRHITCWHWKRIWRCSLCSHSIGWCSAAQKRRACSSEKTVGAMKLLPLFRTTLWERVSGSGGKRQVPQKSWPSGTL